MPVQPHFPTILEPQVPQEQGLASGQGVLGLSMSALLQASGCGLQCAELFHLCLQALLKPLVLVQEHLHLGRGVLAGAGIWECLAILVTPSQQSHCPALSHPQAPQGFFWL